MGSEGNDARLQRYRRACAGLTGPFAFVDLDAFDANVQAIAERSNGKPIRLASKSIRVPALLKRVLDNDSRYSGVLAMCPAEAVHLAGTHGIDDIVVAYPSLDARGIDAVGRLVAQGHRITLMVDSAEHLVPIEEAGRTHGVRMPVAIDLDVSQDYPGLHFGMLRSPLTTPDQAVVLARRIAASAWLVLDGLMGYEGQVAGLGNIGRHPRTTAIRVLQGRAIGQVAGRRQAVVAALRADGHDLRFVNAGGTGSLETSSSEDAVTEVAMGSGLFSPTLFDAYRGFRHQPAAGFALTVVRRPARGVVTCMGGGFIASGPTGPTRAPTPWLPDGLRLVPDEGAGEVQTPLVVPPEVDLRVGDLVFFRHAKAGELSEHANELLAISGDEVVDRFPTYRGEGLCFP